MRSRSGGIGSFGTAIRACAFGAFGCLSLTASRIAEAQPAPTAGSAPATAPSPAIERAAEPAGATRFSDVGFANVPSPPVSPLRQWVHTGLYYSNRLSLRGNPLGLFNEFRFGYRVRLAHGGDDAFIRGSFAGLSIVPSVSPAFGRIGVLAEFAPLAILQFFAAYEFTGYWGAFGVPRTYTDARANWSDAQRSMGRGLQTTGHQVQLGVLAQIRLGPIAVRNNTRWFFNYLEGAATDRVAYDSYYDLLMPRNGWFVVNDADLIVSTEFRLNVGVRYTHSNAYFSPEDCGGNCSTIASATNRIGPVITWSFFERQRSGFNAPTLFLLVQWWLQHPHRTGALPDSVSQAIPLIAGGLAFRGEIL